MLTDRQFTQLVNLVFSAANDGKLPDDFNDVEMLVIFGKLADVQWRLGPVFNCVDLAPARHVKQPQREI